MNVPDARTDLLTDDVRQAVERGLPFVHQWLAGDGPLGHTIRLPCITRPGQGGMFLQTITVEKRYYRAPAPWAGRVYCYVWPAAEVSGHVIAHGEPYRVFDDYATFLAAAERP